MNETVGEDGIRFKITPSATQVDKNYKVAFKIAYDLDGLKEKPYEFEVRVLDELVAFGSVNYEYTPPVEKEKEKLDVTI